MRKSQKKNLLLFVLLLVGFHGSSIMTTMPAIIDIKKYKKKAKH